MSLIKTPSKTYSLVPLSQSGFTILPKNISKKIGNNNQYQYLLNRKFVDLIKNSDIKTSVGVEHMALNCPYNLRIDTIGDLVL